MKRGLLAVYRIEESMPGFENKMSLRLKMKMRSVAIVIIGLFCSTLQTSDIMAPHERGLDMSSGPHDKPSILRPRSAIERKDVITINLGGDEGLLQYLNTLLDISIQPDVPPEQKAQLLQDTYHIILLLVAARRSDPRVLWRITGGEIGRDLLKELELKELRIDKGAVKKLVFEAAKDLSEEIPTGEELSLRRQFIVRYQNAFSDIMEFDVVLEGRTDARRKIVKKTIELLRLKRKKVREEIKRERDPSQRTLKRAVLISTNINYDIWRCLEAKLNDDVRAAKRGMKLLRNDIMKGNRVLDRIKSRHPELIDQEEVNAAYKAVSQARAFTYALQKRIEQYILEDLREEIERVFPCEPSPQPPPAPTAREAQTSILRQRAFGERIRYK